MNRRWFCGVLGILAFGVLAGQAAASDAVKLEYKFAAGELIRYKVSQKASGGMMDMFGENTVQVTEGILRMRVSKILANGDAEIRAAYESGTYSAIEETTNISADYVAPVTFQVSKNGVIRNAKQAFEKAGKVSVTRDDEEGGKRTMRSNIYGPIVQILFRGLPTREVKVGATWEASSSGTENPGAIGRSKLVSINTLVKGMPAAVISTTADVKDDSSNGSGDDSQLNIQVTVNSKTSFSVEKGRVITMDDVLQFSLSNSSSDGKATTTISTQAALLPADKVK